MTSDAEPPGAQPAVAEGGGQHRAELVIRRVGSLVKDGRVQGGAGVGVLIGFAIGLLVSGKPWHLQPAWGDIPTWISAIATIGLLIGAIVAARYAIKAFGKQATEVAILTEEAKRQAAERRKAQAAAVWIGVQPQGNRLVQPTAYNSSSLPIFDVQFWYSYPGQLTGPDDLGMIMPGPTGWNGRQMSYNEAIEHATLTFRDAEGVRWIRLPDGILKEQERDTARDSVLAALGEPLPVPAQAIPLAEPAGQPEEPGEPEASAGQ
jgi:hypothetical protein